MRRAGGIQLVGFTGCLLLARQFHNALASRSKELEECGRAIAAHIQRIESSIFNVPGGGDIFRLPRMAFG